MHILGILQQIYFPGVWLAAFVLDQYGTSSIVISGSSLNSGGAKPCPLT
jgi:hypothetical protein